MGFWSFLRRGQKQVGQRSELETEVRLGFKLLSEHPQASDERLIRSLVKLGVPDQRARQLVLFVPLAALRVFPNIPWPETYVVLRKAPETEEEVRMFFAGADWHAFERKLCDVEVYLEAIRLLPHLKGVNLEPVYMRTAEMSALSQLIQQDGQERDFSKVSFIPTAINPEILEGK